MSKNGFSQHRRPDGVDGLTKESVAGLLDTQALTAFTPACILPS